MDKTHELGLSMDKCRGQGYDGAGSMAGRVKGVAARISEGRGYPQHKHLSWYHRDNTTRSWIPST